MSFGEYYNGFSQLGSGIVDAIDQAQAPDILAALLKQNGGGQQAPGGLAALGAPPPALKLPSFAGGSAPMTLPTGGNKEIENQFIGALKDGGLTNPNGLAAAAAYAQRESRYNPKNITGSWSDPSESGQAGQSGGILSWRADRLDKMRAFTAGAPDPVKAQAQFFLTENPDVTLALQNAKSPEEANDILAQAWKFAGYNRPGGGEYAARLGTTRAYLNRVAGIDPGPASAPSQQPVRGLNPGRPQAPTAPAQRPVQFAETEADVQRLEQGMMPGVSTPAPAGLPRTLVPQSMAGMGIPGTVMDRGVPVAQVPAPPPRMASADPQADMPVRSAQEAGFVIPPGPGQSPAGPLANLPSGLSSPQPRAPLQQQPSYPPSYDGAAQAARPAGPIGLPGVGGVQRGLDPALLARALNNRVTAPFAQAAIASQLKTGDDYAFTAVGDQFYRTNRRTGAVELVPGVTKPQTTTVAPGSYLVDQVTGRPLFSAPAKPENVAAGSRLVDPNTGLEVYAAPEKPVSVAPGATLYDPTTRQGIYTAPEKSGTPSFVQMNGRLVLTDPDTGSARDVTPADLPQGYRPATADERRAYGVQDTTPLVIGPDGKPQSLGGQTINVNPGERAQESAIGGDYGKRFIEYQRSGAGATGQLSTIAAMEKAMNSPGFYSGSGGAAHLAFNRGLVALGVKDSKAAAPGELFDALSNKVILDGLGGSLGAGISNGDRDFIQRTAPDLAKTAEGNRQLLEYARALAQRQQEVAKFSRDYYAKNGRKLDPGFDEALAQWAEANPITPGGRRSAGAAQQQSAPQPARGVPAVNDLEAEARRRGLIQ